jgi:hypothetical protein
MKLSSWENLKCRLISLYAMAAVWFEPTPDHFFWGEIAALVESLDYTTEEDPVPDQGNMWANWRPASGFTNLALAEKNDNHTRCTSAFSGLLIETSLLGSLNEGALRLMGEFPSSRISAPTDTEALKITPDPDKPGAFSVYNST